MILVGRRGADYYYIIFYFYIDFTDLHYKYILFIQQDLNGAYDNDAKRMLTREKEKKFRKAFFSFSRSSNFRK